MWCQYDRKSCRDRSDSSAACVGHDWPRGGILGMRWFRALSRWLGLCGCVVRLSRFEGCWICTGRSSSGHQLICGHSVRDRRGRNPVRVGELSGVGPKVGLRASGQPWAGGRNPVGIGGDAGTEDKAGTALNAAAGTAVQSLRLACWERGGLGAREYRASRARCLYGGRRAGAQRSEGRVRRGVGSARGRGGVCGVR